MQIPMILLTLVLLSSNAFANCVTNERGRVVCSNGSEAGGYNSRTGTAWKSTRNENGVATTQTSRAERPRPKMARAYIRVPMAKTVTRQHPATAVIEELGSKETASTVFSRDFSTRQASWRLHRTRNAGGTNDEYSMVEAIGCHCDIGDTGGMRD